MLSVINFLPIECGATFALEAVNFDQLSFSLLCTTFELCSLLFASVIAVYNFFPSLEI